MTEQEVLHSPFNVETHKKTFINYLEVIIDEDGVIHYAVPSHNQALEKIVCDKNNIEYNDWNVSSKASELCPRDRWFDYPEWLCEQTNYIMVWGYPYSHIVGKPNDKQKETLDMLRREELL